jgi:hypothetical protein
MVGLNGVSLPAALAPLLGGFADVLTGAGVTFALGGGSRFVLTWAWTLPLLAIALLMPNTQELMRHYRPGLDFDPTTLRSRLAWRPTRAWSLALAVLTAAGLLSLSQATEFLYYQF